MVTEVKGPTAAVVSIEGRGGPGPVRTAGTAGTSTTSITRPQVSITGDAATMAALERAVAASPEVDPKRVEAVQTALAEGSYQVDPRRTADQFLRLENLMAAATTRGAAGNDD